MEEKMTVHDALVATINLLGNISVPRSLNQLIGIPIDNAINNLRLCVGAIEKATEERENNGNSNVE
jgi:hypothetical protein